MTCAAPAASAAGAPVLPRRGTCHQRRPVAEGKQGHVFQEQDGKGEGAATDTTTSADSEDPDPCSYHLYHGLITYPLKEIRLPTSQRQRVARAIQRQRMRNHAGDAEQALLMQACARHPAAMVGWDVRNPRKEKFSTCPPRLFDRHTNFGGMSKKILMDTMRSVVFLSAVRRERERRDFASTGTAAQRKGQQQQQQANSSTDTNIIVSPTTAAGRWHRLAGFSHLAGEQAKPAPAVAIVAAAAATAHAAAGNESKPDSNHHSVSLAPFMAIQRLMRRVRRADLAGGAETNNRRQQLNATHPGVFSSKDAKHLLKATVASLEEAGGRRGDQGNSSTLPSFDWTRFIYGEGDDDGPAEHGRNGEDSMHLVGLGDIQKAQLDLAAVREKAAIEIPRNSRRRGRVANARIDAILYALIKESLWGAKEPEPSYRCGRDEEGEGKAAAEEGKRSTKRDGSNDDAAPHVLSNNDMEAVIVFVDRDGSGEIDVGEFQAAISAAKRGKLLDARLSDCIRRIDHVLRLQHLGIHDVFRMMDPKGSGKLSREELANGLSALSAQSRAHVLERRKELRRNRKYQKDEEYRRRARVARFLTDIDDLREALRERDCFATGVTDEQPLREVLRHICEADDDDDDAASDDSDCEHCDDEEGGVGNGKSFPSSWHQACPYDTDDGRDGSNHPQTPAQQRKLRGRRHRKKRKTQNMMRSIVGFRAECAQLHQLKHDVLARRKVATAAAAAAATAIPTGATTTVEKAASEAPPRPEQAAEEETEENHLSAENTMQPWDEGNNSSDGGNNGGGGNDERSEYCDDQEDPVNVGGLLEGREAGDENDRGGRASSFGNVVGVAGGPTVSSSGAVSGVGGGTGGGSGGHTTTFPLIMRICGEEGRGEQKVEFPAAFREQDDRSAASNKGQQSSSSSRRCGAAARDNKRAGDGNARRRRPPSSPPAEASRTTSSSGQPSRAKPAGKSAASGLGGPRGRRAQARVGTLAKKGRETGVGEDVVEKQKIYALNDRYLRVYLQRRFEQEQLPRLFAARSSRSTLHRYTVTNPYEMTQKQAAHIPRLV